MQTVDKAKTDSAIMRSLPWFAVVAVLAAGAIFVHTTLFYLNASQATCTVLKVDVIRGTSSNSGTTYRPTIQYTDAQGLNHLVEFTIATNYYNFNVGQKVAILYDVTDPQSVRFNTFLGIWGLTAGLAITAMLIVVLAWASNAAKRRTLRQMAMREGKMLTDDDGCLDHSPH